MGVSYERVRTAAVLTIDRPERRNAVDGPTAALLLDGFQRFAADDTARTLVLTGAGGVAFCAGADLKAISTLNPDAPGGPLGFTRLQSPKPTIAAIDGWCLAGGFELALWCDLRIATPASTFGCAERRWGVPLIDGGTQRLPRIVGQGRALDLVLTGRMVEAGEALAMGLVTELSPDPLDRALELAEELARFPQETMVSDRRALLDAQGLEHEAKLGRAVLQAGVRGAARFAGGAGRGGAPAE
jgi:enoyl-CoA hydratase